jgi:hypothetical protein
LPLFSDENVTKEKFIYRLERLKASAITTGYEKLALTALHSRESMPQLT